MRQCMQRIRSMPRLLRQGEVRGESFAEPLSRSPSGRVRQQHSACNDQKCCGGGELRRACTAAWQSALEYGKCGCLIVPVDAHCSLELFALLGIFL